MSIAKVLLDESIKLYVNKNGAEKDRAINISRIAKTVDANQALVWRQIHQNKNIRVESFLRLLVALENIWVDKDRNLLIIGLTGEEEIMGLIDRFTKAHFKKEYTI